MKKVRGGLTFLEAKELSDKLALEHDKVFSVRTTNQNPYRKSFYVAEGMIGSEFYARWTSRPQTLRWAQAQERRRHNPGG